MCLRVPEGVEGRRHSIEADNTGDQRSRVHLALGEHVERVPELKPRGIAIGHTLGARLGDCTRGFRAFEPSRPRGPTADDAR